MQFLFSNRKYPTKAKGLNKLKHLPFHGLVSFLFGSLLFVASSCGDKNFTGATRPSSPSTNDSKPDDKDSNPVEPDSPPVDPAVDPVYRTVEDTTYFAKPREGCQAYFSGIFPHLKTADEQPYETVAFFSDNPYSEWIGEGKAAENVIALAKSVAYTFDGIAAVKGTRVVIYEQANFKGRIVFDKVGPFVLYNGALRHLGANLPLGNWGTFESIFPPKTRIFSDEDMHPWSIGSTVIECL